ncbi:hypothetical protein BH09ACT10_BH09ACT10_30270 [soil metagenome]
MAYRPSRFELQWPELFEGLADWQRRGINQRLANASLEGWNATAEGIAALIADVIDIDDRDEFRRRVLLSPRTYNS